MGTESVLKPATRRAYVDLVEECTVSNLDTKFTFMDIDSLLGGNGDPKDHAPHK